MGKSTTFTPENVKKVHDALRKHKGVATLSELEKATGIRGRVLHNLTWRMEGAPRGGVMQHREDATIARAQTDGRTVSYRKLAAGESTYQPARKFDSAVYATKSSLEA